MIILLNKYLGFSEEDLENSQLAIEGFVFTATAYEGTPTETAEAIPAWIDKDKIPYEKMWADDRLWLPLLLEGRRFTGRFLFDKDAMLGYEVSTEGCT